MKNEIGEANYARYSANPNRISGTVHNSVIARSGPAFNYSTMEEIDAVEISFVNEPYGNMRSILVADLAAARTLRDQLDAILAANPEVAR